MRSTCRSYRHQWTRAALCGWIGYVPTAKIIQEGGYESRCTEYAELFAINVEDVLLAGLKNMISEMWGGVNWKYRSGSGWQICLQKLKSWRGCPGSSGGRTTISNYDGTSYQVLTDSSRDKFGGEDAKQIRIAVADYLTVFSDVGMTYIYLTDSQTDSQNVTLEYAQSCSKLLPIRMRWLLVSNI